MTRHVVIAGAGIGGLTAALALLQRGFDVTVFEQATGLRELGAGLQLGPNGTRVLIALGLGPAMERIVCRAAGKEIRLWSTGQAWPLFDLGETAIERYGAPYWMVHRGDFHAALSDAARSAVRLGVECTGFAQDRDGVTLASGCRRSRSCRCAGRCGRRAFLYPPADVRPRRREVHRTDGLARPGADAAPAGTPAPSGRRQLGGCRWSRRHLSAAARRNSELRRRGGA